MRIYDTLIIGCGYSSAGYALAGGNCILCEENQLCDSHFTMPLGSFRYHRYTPKTPDHSRLLEAFTELELFSPEKGMQNTGNCDTMSLPQKLRNEIRGIYLWKTRYTRTVYGY